MTVYVHAIKARSKHDWLTLLRLQMNYKQKPECFRYQLLSLPTDSGFICRHLFIAINCKMSAQQSVNLSSLASATKQKSKQNDFYFRRSFTYVNAPFNFISCRPKFSPPLACWFGDSTLTLCANKHLPNEAEISLMS